MKHSRAYLLLGIALAGLATPAVAQSTPPPAGQASASQTPATAADFTAGASVRDSKGVAVGKVDSVDKAKGAAIVDTGQTKIGVPITMFTKDSNGVMLTFTAEQFNLAVAKAHARSEAAKAQQPAPAQSTTPPAQPQPQ